MDFPAILQNNRGTICIAINAHDVGGCDQGQTVCFRRNLLQGRARDPVFNDPSKGIITDIGVIIMQE